MYFLAGLSIFLMTGCEDPIDVALDDAPRLLTVDAWINDLPVDQVITLSRSQSFFDSLRVEGVTGAEVSVISSSGVTYEYEESDTPGQYVMAVNDLWTQEPVGLSYALIVNTDGNQYVSGSVKNDVPPIDSIQQELRVDDPFVDDGIFCNFFATDLPGLGNSYWIKTFKDDVFLNKPAEINIAFDAAFSAGAMVDNLVFIQPIQELTNQVDENFAPIPWEPGEEVRVEIHSITNEAFFFMEVLRDQLLNSSNGIFAEPLANTPTNIIAADQSEAVIGFFNVASVSTMTDTIR